MEPNVSAGLRMVECHLGVNLITVCMSCRADGAIQPAGLSPLSELLGLKVFSVIFGQKCH